jgi:AraC family transcriptional regulator
MSEQNCIDRSLLETETHRLSQGLRAILALSLTVDDELLLSLSRRLYDHLQGRDGRPDTPTGCGLAPWQERRAKALLRNNLGNRLFIAEVAQQCAMSRSHFRSLTEIGQDCGFCDQAHFTRTFNRLVGLSPNRWRHARRSIVAVGI